MTPDRRQSRVHPPKAMFFGEVIRKIARRGIYAMSCNPSCCTEKPMDAYIATRLTLHALLRRAAFRFPGREAVVHPEQGHRRTWAELDAEADVLARGLMACGVQKGEKIALWAANVPYWVSLMFAASRIGAILMPINAACRNAELRFFLRDSGCETLFLIDRVQDHDFTAALRAIIPQSFADGRVNSTEFPHLRRVFLLSRESRSDFRTLKDLYAEAHNVSPAALEARAASVSASDVVSMQYTSGTTGSPKGALLTHLNIVNSGHWTACRQQLSEQDRLCLPVPLFHCFGCVSGVVACTVCGATMVILESCSPVRVLRAVEEEQCTVIYGVPSLFQALLNHRVAARCDLTSLRTGIMGGSVCPESLVRAVMEQFRLPGLTIGYGLTETSPMIAQTSLADPPESRIDNVGRPLPGLEISILDPKTGRECVPGTPGEICCKGSNVMQGYHAVPQEAFGAVDDQGRLRTGDLGWLDAEGRLHISGRLKDVIVRGGENVYPREIEEFLLQWDKVADVQVVAVPSRRYGEEVGVFIIPRSGAVIRPKDVRAFCGGQIAWYKIPRYVAVVAFFPMTANGKVRKAELRKAAARLFPEAMRPGPGGLRERPQESFVA